MLPDLRRKLEPHRSEIALVREHATQAQTARHVALTGRVRGEMDAGALTPLIAAHEVLRGAGPRAALWTAARERLPVTFVVMNNQRYGILKNYMKDQGHCARARGRFTGLDLINPPVDFSALAASMGRPRFGSSALPTSPAP